jgi:hypothetical protein
LVGDVSFSGNLGIESGNINMINAASFINQFITA